MNSLIFEEQIPSKSITLLSKCVGTKIINWYRASWDSFENFDPYNLYNIARSDFFRLTSGAAVVQLDNGFEIAFGSQEGINSVTVWCEKTDKNQTADDYFKTDSDTVLISAIDKIYMTEREVEIVDQTIRSVHFFKQEPKSSRYSGLPNEVGVQLELGNGEKIVFAHNLIQAPDTIAITYLNEIDKSQLDIIELIKIS